MAVVCEWAAPGLAENLPFSYQLRRHPLAFILGAIVVLLAVGGLFHPLSLGCAILLLVAGCEVPKKIMFSDKTAGKFVLEYAQENPGYFEELVMWEAVTFYYTERCGREELNEGNGTRQDGART
ncbi:hypothetical protein BGE01nite_51720 [Brevifollis gellanilyticus]|uniref:Uncharacterized protein n=2 Tax=Brevifollis gellanilyticus TaxID=748831 RepID=A0A512MHS4_9BACT|nr:hypothetical protein BGE01nite_51720 [Brevifollis gellanilyticus]